MRRHDPHNLTLRACMTAALGLAACFQPQGNGDDTGASSSTGAVGATDSTTAQATDGTTTGTTGVTVEPPTSTTPPDTTLGPELTSEPETGTGVTSTSTTSETTSESSTTESCICGDSVVCGDEQCDDGSELCALCKRTKYYVFLSASETDGALTGKSGIAGGDGICQQQAEQAGLPASTYFAWLSSNDVSPASRFAPVDVPYVLPVTMEEVGDYATLTSTGPKHLIDRLANGEQLVAPGAACTDGSLVWTGTDAGGGGVGGSHCSSWTSSLDGMTGTVGTFAPAAGGQWTACPPRTCSALARLYCFEQP